MAHLADYDIRKQHFAVIKKTERLTPADSEEIREIQLEVLDDQFNCEVDQSFGVLVNVRDDFGNSLHHRLYSVADLPEKTNGKTNITMLVKRCNYIDEFSGELERGLASNYLCDRSVGDQINITGPYPLAFQLPKEKDANLILIGMGTGIAPFRAFIKHIHKKGNDFKGKILLFYGAKTGLDLLYLNEEKGDLTNYYDKETFEAISALSKNPLWEGEAHVHQAVSERAEEVLKLLKEPNTYVYVAGHHKVNDQLDESFEQIYGDARAWTAKKEELMEQKKWVELIY